MELNLGNVQLADNLSVGTAPIPASGTEETAVAAVQEAPVAAEASGTWFSRGMNRIKKFFGSNPAAPAEAEAAQADASPAAESEPAPAAEAGDAEKAE